MLFARYIIASSISLNSLTSGSHDDIKSPKKIRDLYLIKCFVIIFLLTYLTQSKGQDKDISTPLYPRSE